jgi:hypothetical protein
MIKLYFTIISICFFTNLFSQGIESVIKVGDTPLKSLDNVFIYALPRTHIAVKVMTCQKVLLCGPYSAFAEELLGIKNAPSNNSVEWKIDSIDVESYTDANPEELYAIQTSKGFNPNSIAQLTEAGFIVDPSLNRSKHLTNIATPNIDPLPLVPFKMLSEQRFYKEFSDTLYKTILRDSIYIRIPIIKSKIEAKTTRDKAREAADVILKIRQRRIDIVTSEDEVLPEEKSYKLALSEMKKIEKEYTTLFTGKEIHQHFTSWYTITPSTNNIDKQNALFYFSKSKGISLNSNDPSSPVYISFAKEDKLNTLTQWFDKAENKDNKHLIYLIPDATTITVSNNNYVFTNKKTSVFQYGVKAPFPVNLNK